MRVMIEIEPEHHVRLLELAARRRQRGVSTLIREALDAYLKVRTPPDKARARARQLKGTLTAEDAAVLRSATQELRGSR